MNHFYYLNRRNEVQGPVSINELLELLANGIIQTTTLVARVGDAAWRPLPSVLADMNITAPCPPCRRRVPNRPLTQTSTRVGF